MACLAWFLAPMLCLLKLRVTIVETLVNPNVTNAIDLINSERSTDKRSAFVGIGPLQALKLLPADHDFHATVFITKLLLCQSPSNALSRLISAKASGSAVRASAIKSASASRKRLISYALAGMPKASIACGFHGRTSPSIREAPIAYAGRHVISFDILITISHRAPTTRSIFA
jgi:hypothetical protein